jgi:hypothetical protein
MSSSTGNMLTSRLVDYTKHRRDDMPSQAERLTELVKNIVKHPLKHTIASPSNLTTIKAAATTPATIQRSIRACSSHSERTNSMGDSSSTDTAPIEFYLKRMSLGHRHTRRSYSEDSRGDLLLELERRTSSSRVCRNQMEGLKKYDAPPEESSHDPHTLEGKTILCPKSTGRRYNHIQRILRNPTLSRSFHKESYSFNSSRDFLRSASEPRLQCPGSKAA